MLLPVEDFLLQDCGVFSIKGLLSVFGLLTPWRPVVGGKVVFSPLFFSCLPLGLICILCLHLFASAFNTFCLFTYKKIKIGVVCVVGFCLTLIRICMFEGRTSHPSIVPLLLSIYILFLIQKKKKLVLLV